MVGASSRRMTGRFPAMTRFPSARVAEAPGRRSSRMVLTGTELQVLVANATSGAGVVGPGRLQIVRGCYKADSDSNPSRITQT